MELSVVIPAYDEAEGLRPTLRPVALQRVLKPRKPVGSILVGLGVIGKSHVSEALVEGVRDVIAQAAKWSVGSYEFDPYAAVERDATFAGVDIESLIPGAKVTRFAIRGR